MINKRLFEATATLIGTVIGAGVLAIPYVISKAGFWTGVVDIVVIGVILTILLLYLGEISLRTKGFHQLTGYAEKYLGKTGKKLMFIAMIFGIYGALVAYLIGGGQSLSALIGFGSPVIYSLMFFVITTTIIYFGLKAVEEFEVFIVPIMILLVIIIAVVGFSRIDSANFTGFNLSRILIPYGTIFFAFFGAAAIPEMREELVKNEKNMKKAILLGIGIPMALYIIFTIVTVGVTGANITQIATIGLGNVIGAKMMILGNLFAVFAMAAVFSILAIALKEMYMLDYKLNKNLAWAISCFVPLLIFFIVKDLAGFGDVIGITGAVAGGLTGILIILMAWKAKKLGNRKPEYVMIKNKFLGIILIIILLIGMIYELLRIIGLINF